MRFKFTPLFCAVSLVSFVGCTQPSELPESAVGNAQPDLASTSVEKPLTAQDGYPQLLAVVSKTQMAVDVNDFTKAQEEFEKFESVWAPVEDGIKAKSDDSYDAIEEAMEDVESALRSSQVDQATSALQTISAQVQNIPQG